MKDDAVRYSIGHVAETSLTLLDKVRGKDTVAWQRLVSLYTPLICHWCKLARLSLDDMEEVVQEVFMAVAHGIGSFRRDREGDTFRGWLRAITKTKIIDHASPPGGTGAGGSSAYERLKTQPDFGPFDESDPAFEEVEKNILYNRAVELIETNFEPKTRRAFWRLIGGQRPQDVATDLELTIGAVYVARSRILRRLRDEFRGLIDEEEPLD